MIRTIIAAIAVFILAGQASAQTCSALLSWVAPTENVDGTPLTDLEGYRLYYGQSPSSFSESVTISSPTTTSHRIENLTAATWYFVATAFNSLGLESEYSNMVSKTTVGCVVMPDPRSPGELTVAGDAPRTVFDFLKRPNRAVLLGVGTVPAGVVCNGSEAVVVGAEIYYAVPRELVTWLGNVEPDVVYTRCE